MAFLIDNLWVIDGENYIKFISMSELPQVHGVVAQRGEHKEQGYAIFFAY